ncbi:MAG: TonB-dependent receptor [Spirochaetia bacterium]|jgi:outer membrane receptor for ferrienterochelin and colicins|nr:TonB-dependent receptor [Spirochaetia bacterium]
MKPFAAVFFIVEFLLLFPLWAQEGDSALELEAITVTGTRTEKRLADTPVVTEVITAEEIENSNADTLTDILDDYGLMYTSGPMGDYIQLQGMGEGRVLYLIDGRRVTGRIAQRLNGETLPLGNVERIEIVRGPQSALYGSDGIGGVINIITKKPDGDVSLSVSLTNRFLLAYDDPDTPYKADPFLDFNPLREQTAMVKAGFPLAALRNNLTLEGSRGDFYYAEKEATSILPEYKRGKAGFDSAFNPGDASEVRLGGAFMLLRSDDKTNTAGSLERRDYLRANGYAETDFTPLENGNLTLRLYDDYYQRDKDTYSALIDTWFRGDNHEEENLVAAEALGVYDGVEDFIFTLGLEGAYNRMDKYNLRNDGTLASLNKQAVFVQAENFAEGVYSLIGGLRLERNSMFGLAAAPKLSAMYHLSKEFRVLGGAGLGYRAPSFNDLYVTMDETVVSGHPTVLGNEDLKPEYALGFNAALEYSAEKRFAQLNVYYTELSNEIAYADTGAKTSKNAVIYKNENVFRSFRTGVDGEAKITLFEHGFVSAGYSYLYAYDRSEEEKLHIQPAHTAKTKAGADFKGAGIHTYLQGRWFSPLDPSDPDYDNARLILDFYFSAAIGGHIKIRLSVDNITGETDPLGPITAQTFSLGIQYSL